MPGGEGDKIIKDSALLIPGGMCLGHNELKEDVLLTTVYVKSLVVW